jgi:hypothetical protein
LAIFTVSGSKLFQFRASSFQLSFIQAAVSISIHLPGQVLEGRASGRGRTVAGEHLQEHLGQIL